MNLKENILACLETLKREKPEGWKKDARRLVKDLERLDDPFGEHEWIGSENLGRIKGKAPDCPTFDRMGPGSDPNNF